MIKKNFFKIFPIILLAAAIALFPSFSVGQIEGGRVIEIRIEDILIVILGLVWIANFLVSEKKDIKKPPLFFPILAWLGIGFLSVLTNLIFGNIEISRGFFYFLKEIEFFFLYFYLFYHIKSIDTAKFIIKIWIFLGLVNIGWIIYQIIKDLNFLGGYGPGMLGEPAAPLPSGGFFLILFIFFFNILLYYYLNTPISNLKKGLLGILLISPALGVFTSASRAAFLGLIFSLFLTFLFCLFKKGKIKPFFTSVLILIIVSAIFISTFSILPETERLLNFKNYFWEFGTTGTTSRLGIWMAQLSKLSEHPLFIPFGLGKSVVLLGEESHSQYVRNLIETGIIGSLVFLFLMFIIIKKSWQGFSKGKDLFLIGLSSGLLVTTLTMLFISISAEAFIVVKIAEVYWFFTAITMAVLVLTKQKEKCVE